MVEVYRAAWVIAYRELLRYVQERTRLVSSFAMPLLFLVIFGAGLNRVIGQLTPGVDFIQFMYPGIISMSVLMTSLFSGLSVVWDREFGFLKEVLVAPLNRGAIVLGKVIGGGAVAVGQGLVLLMLAPIIGVDLDIMLVVKLVPILAVMAFTLSSLGILIASRMRSQQGFQVLVQVIIFPTIFLAGVFFPVNNVPLWLEVVAKVNPLTYAVDAVRQVFLAGYAGAGDAAFGVVLFGHTTTALQDIGIVAAVGAALMALATWSFSRQE